MRTSPSVYRTEGTSAVYCSVPKDLYTENFHNIQLFYTEVQGESVEAVRIFKDTWNFLEFNNDSKVESNPI